MRTFITIVIAALLISSRGWAQTPEDAMREILQSHIDANVPDPADFDSFLRRDLATYFEERMNVRSPTIQVEFLRQGPTQIGIAYPKFYAWVVVRGGDGIVEAGAVRIAAIDRVRFEVTDFLSKQEINFAPAAVATIFPAPIVSIIRERASR